MNRVIGVALTLALILIAGCGKSSAPAGGSAAGGTTSKYDSGPRAGQQPIDASLVSTGEELFKTKGCSACHAYDKRVTGPALKGVTMRRTAEWMQNQILHPEVMTKEDPISHQLLATYAVQMTNQHLTPDEAKAVIEYFKSLDKQSGEIH